MLVQLRIRKGDRRVLGEAPHVVELGLVEGDAVGVVQAHQADALPIGDKRAHKAQAAVADVLCDRQPLLRQHEHVERAHRAAEHDGA